MARKRGRPPAPSPRELLRELLEYELGVAAEEIGDGLALGPLMDDDAREGLATSVEDHFGLPEGAAAEVTGLGGLTFSELLEWVQMQTTRS